LGPFHKHHSVLPFLKSFLIAFVQTTQGRLTLIVGLAESRLATISGYQMIGGFANDSGIAALALRKNQPKTTSEQLIVARVYINPLVFGKFFDLPSNRMTNNRYTMNWKIRLCSW
jgi:hypothetical protein